MPLYADRVQETTATTGTGTLTLAGAVAQYQAFQAAFAVGARIRYAIKAGNGTDWEVGDGVLTAATTLTRENVYASSNAGALVNLTGTSNVFGDLPALAIADVGLSLYFRHYMIPR